MNAYKNHGRWVADCDTAYCTEAQMAVPGRQFVCSECQHVAVPVFPDDMLLIDAALDRRIVAATRNWTVGETVNYLLQENDAHVGLVT